MSRPIEDYGLIGNMLSCALVSRDGSIDWLCLPRFDSDACFAALPGTPQTGLSRIAPAGGPPPVSRRSRPGTTILATTFQTHTSAATPIHFMPPAPTPEHAHDVRLLH